MGKILWREDGDHFNNIQPGCMSGVFPVLDYQNWHSNVKKILPHRRHARQQKAILKKFRMIKTLLKHHGFCPAKEVSSSLYQNELKLHFFFQGDQSTKKHNSHTWSIKSRHKKGGPNFHRTYSIHHLETDEWVLHSNCEEFSEKKPDKDDTNKELKDYVDISENSRILVDGSQVSFTKAKLTKSGSFPSMLGSRKLRPTKLEHKLNEFYSVPKNEKGSDNWGRKLDLPNYESLMMELDQEDGKNLNDDLNNGSIISIKRIRSLTERGNKSNVIHNTFYALPIEEEGGQKTHDIKSNSSSQECQQLEFRISEGLKPLRVSEEGVKDNIKSVNTHDHNDEYFNYVKEILERSGFIKNGFEQTWYSSNQLLNPLVFQEIESQYQYDPECFEEEVIELSHHLHRFDLVDETLLKLYERSFSYYPKALSYSCHLNPAFSGKHVLEGVWKRVSQLAKLKLDTDQSLESIVSWDFKFDDWMNLQMESECVALELEDMIFNELLEEVLCSY